MSATTNKRSGASQVDLARLLASKEHFPSKLKCLLWCALRTLPNVRYSPESGHCWARLECPLWAKSRHRDDYCECHTGGAVATALGQTVTKSLLRHWTMIGTDSVFRPV